MTDPTLRTAPYGGPEGSSEHLALLLDLEAKHPFNLDSPAHRFSPPSASMQYTLRQQGGTFDPVPDTESEHPVLTLRITVPDWVEEDLFDLPVVLLTRAIQGNKLREELCAGAIISVDDFATGGKEIDLRVRPIHATTDLLRRWGEADPADIAVTTVLGIRPLAGQDRAMLGVAIYLGTVG